MKNREKHTFALYCQDLAPDNNLTEHVRLSIKNEPLWHRIVHILRLQENEEVILFNAAINLTLTIEAQTFAQKKTLVGMVKSISAHTPLKPAITLVPSLLKKEAFEAIVYTAAQMGVATIQPIITKKTQRAWGGEKEINRLTGLMTAACEQSKQFIVPCIKHPILFEKFIPLKDAINIYFETNGQPLFHLLQKKDQLLTTPIMLLFGPEGGLTDDEQTLLQKMNITCHSLTSSILRAQDAIMVGLGCIRSIIK